MTEFEKSFSPQEEVAALEEAQSDQKFKVLQAKEDLKKVLSTEEGQRVISGIIIGSGFFQSKFIHSGSETYFKQGERSVGTRVLAEAMHAHPEATLAMMKAFFGKGMQ